MAVDFYYASGSPYAWRVWLAPEHKGVAHKRTTLSFDAGDLKTPKFAALNPRRKVPILVDDDFALYESAAVVEYIEDRWPRAQRCSPADMRERAIQRRMVCEIDQYLAKAGQRFASAAAREDTKDVREELALWESAATGDYFTGQLSAVDLSVYPFMALFLRIAGRRTDFVKSDLIGPRLAAWIDRMGALPIVQRTLPPHWK